MNVGDYVRTKYGITQYKEYETTDGTKLLCMPVKDGSQGIFANIEDVIKSSPQIIDLIEVGDYVNGWRVNKIERNDDDTGTIIKIGNTTFNVLDNEEIYTPVHENDSYYQRIEKLKTIVTHEQFESAAYRVEE